MTEIFETDLETGEEINREPFDSRIMALEELSKLNMARPVPHKTIWDID